MLNGVKLGKRAVSSGLPQGSVHGPIHFLAYINDLSDQVKLRVRLFADYMAIFLAFSTEDGSITLQNDLSILELWEQHWDMSFNPSKWQVLHVPPKPSTSSTIPSQRQFYLQNIVTISDDLSWSPHIDSIFR